MKYAESAEFCEFSFRFYPSWEGGAPLYKVAHDAHHKDSRMTEHYLKRKQDLDKSVVDYMEM